MKSTKKITDHIQKLHLTTPIARDDKKREPFIPAGVANKMQVKYDKADPERRKLERDLEEEQGGAGVYNVDLKSITYLRFFIKIIV